MTADETPHVPGQLANDQWIAAPVVDGKARWPESPSLTVFHDEPAPATLGVVHNDPPVPGPYEPVGAAIPRLTQLWARLQADGPTVAAVTQVQLLPGGGGAVHVRFCDELQWLTWADHLGLGFRGQERFGGRSVLLAASGSVTRDDVTARVELRCATVRRGDDR